MNRYAKTIGAAVGVLALVGAMATPAMAQRDRGRPGGPTARPDASRGRVDRGQPSHGRVDRSQPSRDRGHHDVRHDARRGGHTDVRSDARRGGVRFDVHWGSRHHQPARRWIPGHYETRPQKVLVHPGHHVKRFVPPVYQTVCDRFGRAHQVLVRPGHYENVYVPPRYELRTVRVWVPGRFVVAPGHYDGHHKPGFSIGGVLRF